MTPADDYLWIKVTPIFGRVKLDVWFEPQGEVLVGMSMVTRYDENGRFVSRNVEPTGLTMSAPTPDGV